MRTGARRRPLYESAIGQTVLAYVDSTEKQRYLTTVTFARYTRQTLVSKKVLIAVLTQVQREGISMNVAAMVEGAVEIAALSFDCNGRSLRRDRCAGAECTDAQKTPSVEPALPTANEEVLRIPSLCKLVPLGA